MSGLSSKLYRVFFIVIGGFSMLVFSCADRGKKYVDVSSNIKALDLEYPYKVVTTTGFVHELVDAIAGEFAEVVQLIPEGVDPHTYIPTRSDIVDVYYADVVIYSGLHLEGGMYNVFKRMENKRVLYPVGESVEHPLLEQGLGEKANIDDPHIWMDVVLWMKAGAKLAEVFGMLDPKNAAAYQYNAGVYIKKMAMLNDEMNAMFQTIPKRQRILITSHDAFQYFGNRYDFQVYGIQGISTIAEASLKHIGNLIDIIERNEIRSVFIESTISPKYIYALIEGAESRGVIVEEGGSLFADSLGLKGSDEDTYLGMMRYNAMLITDALGGESGRNENSESSGQ